MGRDTEISISEHNSTISGYEIGVVKGKEIAQEVCFIKLTTDFSNRLLRDFFQLHTSVCSLNKNEYSGF